MRKAAFISILFLCSILQSYAQHWQQLEAKNLGLNLEGEIIEKNNALILATFGGIYKSTDYGKNWFYSSNGLVTPESIQVQSICQDSTSIYIVTKDLQIFKSQDEGSSWKYLSKIQAPTSSVFNIKIYVSKKTLYIIHNSVYGAGQIFRSADGISWNILRENNIFLHNIAINDLGIAIFNYSSNLEISSDGKVFAPFQPKIPVLLHNGVFYGNRNVYYIVTYDTLYYSANREEWKYILLPKNKVGYYEMSSKNGAIFLFEQNNHTVTLKKSSDEGITWENIPLTGISDRLKPIFLETKEGCFVKSATEIYFLKNGLSTWEKRTQGIQTKNVNAVNNANNYFYKFSPTEFYNSTNGNTWNKIPISKIFGDTLAFIQNITPFKNNLFLHIFSNNKNYLYKSYDHGFNWVQVTINLPENTSILPTEDNEGNFIINTIKYSNNQQEGLQYYSKDGGETWQSREAKITTFLTKNNTTTLVTKPNIFDSFIYVLDTDGKATATNKRYFYYLDQVTSNKDYIFLLKKTTNWELSYSVDSISRTKDGINWEHVASFTAHGQGGVLNANPTTGKLYYSNSNFLNAIRSEDNGDTWEDIIGDLPLQIRFTKFVFGNDTTYGLTEYNGIWKLTEDMVLTSVSSPLEDNLHVFPNPFTDIISINNKIENGEFCLYTVLGEKILQQKLLSNNIDLSSIQKGVYILELILEGNSRKTKIIKQ